MKQYDTDGNESPQVLSMRHLRDQRADKAPKGSRRCVGCGSMLAPKVEDCLTCEIERIEENKRAMKKLGLQ